MYAEAETGAEAEGARAPGEVATGAGDVAGRAPLLAASSVLALLLFVGGDDTPFVPPPLPLPDPPEPPDVPPPPPPDEPLLPPRRLSAAQLAQDDKYAVARDPAAETDACAAEKSGRRRFGVANRE